MSKPLYPLRYHISSYDYSHSGPWAECPQCKERFHVNPDTKQAMVNGQVWKHCAYCYTREHLTVQLSVKGTPALWEKKPNSMGHHVIKVYKPKRHD